MKTVTYNYVISDAPKVQIVKSTEVGNKILCFVNYTEKNGKVYNHDIVDLTLMFVRDNGEQIVLTDSLVHVSGGVGYSIENGCLRCVNTFTYNFNIDLYYDNNDPLTDFNIVVISEKYVDKISNPNVNTVYVYVGSFNILPNTETLRPIKVSSIFDERVKMIDGNIEMVDNSNANIISLSGFTIKLQAFTTLERNPNSSGFALKLSEIEYFINEDEDPTITLEAFNVTPNASVSWSSEDNEIASVGESTEDYNLGISSCQVTIHANNECNCTITAECGDVTSTCIIHISRSKYDLNNHRRIDITDLKKLLKAMWNPEQVEDSKYNFTRPYLTGAVVPTVLDACVLTEAILNSHYHTTKNIVFVPYESDTVKSVFGKNSNSELVFKVQLDGDVNAATINLFKNGQRILLNNSGTNLFDVSGGQYYLIDDYTITIYNYLTNSATISIKDIENNTVDFDLVVVLKETYLDKTNPNEIKVYEFDTPTTVNLINIPNANASVADRFSELFDIADLNGMMADIMTGDLPDPEPHTN